MLDLIQSLLKIFIGGFLQIFTGIFGGIAQMFNFVDYYNTIKTMADGNATYWIVGALVVLVVLAVLVAIVWLIIYFSVRFFKRLKSKNAVLDQDLVDEINELKRQLVKTNMEKDRILGLKIGARGYDITEGYEGEEVKEEKKEDDAI